MTKNLLHLTTSTLVGIYWGPNGSFSASVATFLVIAAIRTVASAFKEANKVQT